MHRRGKKKSVFERGLNNAKASTKATQIYWVNTPNQLLAAPCALFNQQDMPNQRC